MLNCSADQRTLCTRKSYLLRCGERQLPCKRNLQFKRTPTSSASIHPSLATIMYMLRHLLSYLSASQNSDGSSSLAEAVFAHHAPLVVSSWLEAALQVAADQSLLADLGTLAQKLSCAQPLLAEMMVEALVVSCIADHAASYTRVDDPIAPAVVVSGRAVTAAGELQQLCLQQRTAGWLKVKSEMEVCVSTYLPSHSKAARRRRLAVFE